MNRTQAEAFSARGALTAPQYMSSCAEQASFRYVEFFRFQAIEDQSEMPISTAPASPVMTSGM